MKATSAYKMKKQTKRDMASASLDDKQRRSDWKRLMKEAEVFAEWNAKYGRKTREKVDTE